MSNVKLHINISQGIIDAEGDQEFVWRVYEDFRDRLGAGFPIAEPHIPENDEVSGEVATSDVSAENAKPKKRPQRKKQSQGSTGKEKQGGITTHKPRILSSLDTSGVKEFLAQYKLASHTETIIAMTRFLEGKSITPASLDAYFTCYNDAGLKTPEAFGQAFVNARTKGFITLTTPEDVSLTIRGRNHLDHGGVKKADA